LAIPVFSENGLVMHGHLPTADSNGVEELAIAIISDSDKMVRVECGILWYYMLL